MGGLEVLIALLIISVVIIQGIGKIFLDSIDQIAHSLRRATLRPIRKRVTKKRKDS